MIFGENRKMSKEEKTGQKSDGEVLRRSDGCLGAVKPRVKVATPRVRCSVAMLCHNEELHRCVAVLRRGEDTVHRGKYLDFISEHLLFVHR